jgi:hypothetical protein
MILPLLIHEWPAEWRELWAERAGIMEYEGNLTRSAAEREAAADIRKLAKGTVCNAT